MGFARSSLAALALVLTACKVDLDSVPVAMPHAGAMDASMASDASHADAGRGHGDAQGRRPMSDATSGSVPDAQTDAFVDPPVFSRPAGRHTSCKTAALADGALPRLAIFTDGIGRPRFDQYRDIDCQTLSYPTCGELETTSPDECGFCMHGEPDDVGVCAPDFDVCLPNFAFVTSQAGDCHRCVPAAAKARACCDQMPGFDCRAWPYPSNSKPGELCARHADCEVGLVCRPLESKEAGVCLCPEDSMEAWTQGVNCETVPVP